MINQDMIDRFEELEAGRILGDLDSDEIREWEELSKNPKCQIDFELELAAAALETELIEFQEAEIPESLIQSLKRGTAEYVVAESEDEKVIRPRIWRRVLADSETAWAIAALFIILFVAKSVVDNPSTESTTPIAQIEDSSPEKAREALVAKAGDLIKSSFGGVKNYDQMSGEVVWSDELQEGYMTLTNLPANDPTVKQYQLWIVDPSRDEDPVDGGVFDISIESGTAIIPIRNPLVVANPKAFVITLEQPGGVVVSDQKMVVALATTT